MDADFDAGAETAAGTGADTAGGTNTAGGTGAGPDAVRLAALNRLLGRFPRVDLGFFPTPLHTLPNLGRKVGHPNLWAKRDDLTGLGLGGNKVRSLEFFLGQARSEGADVVVTAGGLQSNLCRLTAAAAAKAGLECVLVHNDNRPDFYQGNMLLNHLFGASEVFIGPADEAARARAVEEVTAEMRRAGRRPYVVANGASTPLGVLGYVRAAAEFAGQSAALTAVLPIAPPASLLQPELTSAPIWQVAMVGAMAGTVSGLALGAALLGRPFHVQVISVEYPEAHLRGLIHSLAAAAWDLLREKARVNGANTGIGLGAAAAEEQLGPNSRSVAFVPWLDAAMTIHDAYLGPGYAVPTELSRQALFDAARLEGLLVEDVYTSKTLAGLLDLIRRGAIAPDEPCCFWHTGGAAALFAQATDLQPRGNLQPRDAGETGSR